MYHAVITYVGGRVEAYTVERAGSFSEAMLKVEKFLTGLAVSGETANALRVELTCLES